MINSRIKTYLDRLADSKTRPSSYIFAGEEDEAKEKAVYYFVSKMVGKIGDAEFLERIKAKNHPDVVVLEPEIEERKGKIREKEIGISQIREALERLKFFPYELEKKICVVRYAQKMNDEASNALLKSLEEPSEKAVYILLAGGTDSILPTIVSRCAVLRFPRTKLPEWDEENRKAFKNIFRSEVFERFEYIEKVSKNKNELISVLKDWEMVMGGSLRKLAADRGNWEDSGNWGKIRKVVSLINSARESINRLENTNASARATA
jgi:DNA polymerase III delta prime subunit